MNYSTYSADDFIKDEYFQRWVFSPDAETEAFWQAFQAQHPDQQQPLTEARRFLLVFHVKEKDVLESRISHLKRRIDLALDQPERQEPRPAETRTAPRRTGNWKAYAIAASLSALVACAFLFLWVRNDKNTPDTDTYTTNA